MLFDYLEARFDELQEERYRWGYLNNSMTQILRSKGAEKAKFFTDGLEKIINKYDKQKDERTDEEITNHVLDLFKKKARE